MKKELDERMMDLLCDKALFGLSEEELRELETFEKNADGGMEAHSLELTAAKLGLIGVDQNAEMPSHLFEKIVADSQRHVAAEENVFTAPRGTVLTEATSGGGIFSWLGWAAAAAACIALAVNIFTTRQGSGEVVSGPIATPTVEERLTPAQMRQRLIDTEQAVVRADWTKGTFKESEGISGDVVWSDAKQAGYIRVTGLPVNDKSKSQYQLWIFEDEKLEKFPKDGGVFDVNENGEVVIPIDAKIAVRDPKAFAITLEKPGGVVVSERGQIAGLAPVKPSQT